MSVPDRTRVNEGSRQEEQPLMEIVVSSANMHRAYQRVVSNQGSAGIDGMGVEGLTGYLSKDWERIKADLLQDAYYPQAVKSVKIPKPNGGERELGIPTVVDRLIQQALYQVLSPLYEPGFSEHSYGFRPGRNAQQAVRKSQDYVREGKRWSVDLDLSKFFDGVNHDRLLSKLRERVLDRRVIHLVDRYLRTVNYEEALADFGHAIELDPEYKWALESRGTTYLEMDAARKAKPSFQSSA